MCRAVLHGGCGKSWHLSPPQIVQHKMGLSVSNLLRSMFSSHPVKMAMVGLGMLVRSVACKG